MMHLHICEGCGAEFAAKQRIKKYCSLKCYTDSDACKARLAAFNEERKKQIERQCSQCGALVIRKASTMGSNWIFCNMVCKRAFLSSVFDRFVHTPNPNDLDLIQNFDEFLSTESIACPVKGCRWSGRRLGMHARMVHGYEAQSFREAMGLNRHTGLVSPDEHSKLSAAAIERVSVDNLRPHWGKQPGSHAQGSPSREAREHRAKAVAALGSEHFSHPITDDTKAKIGEAVARSWARREPVQRVCDDCGATYDSLDYVHRRRRCPSCRKANKAAVFRAWLKARQ